MKREFTILVVDDSRTNRMLLVQYLQHANYTTIEADSAAAAQTIIKRQLPDLILLDVVMPVTSGFELCEILKNEPLTSDIPVIFLTALDSQDDKVKGLEMGAVDFITKPFAPAEVIARVRTQATMHRMICTIRETNDRLARDLDMARGIQMNFLPDRNVPVDEGILFDYTYQPCDELGGDFFDLFSVDPSHVLFYFSDVSGHGVASALMTIFTHTFLRTHTRESTDPAALLERFNREFVGEALGDKYIVAFLAILDTSTDQLTWSSAGMTVAPILYGEERLELLTTDSFPVGIIPDATYTNQTISTPPGTSVLMYSDGLTDLRDPDGNNVLDENQLQEHVRNHVDLSQTEMIDSILNRVRATAAEDSYPDDLTVFLVKRT